MSRLVLYIYVEDDENNEAFHEMSGWSNDEP